MSRPFAKYSAKACFGQVKEPTSSGDYISKKKAAYTNCWRQSNCANSYKEFDQSQLYANLYTKLDLTPVSTVIPIIADLSGNIFPVNIDVNMQPFLKYVIDPDGVLFGNTSCGINNYQNFVVPNLTK